MILNKIKIINIKNAIHKIIHRLYDIMTCLNGLQMLNTKVFKYLIIFEVTKKMIIKMDFNYIKNVNFPNRYISPEKLFFYLEENYRDYIQLIGHSFLGKPIYKFTFGKGDVNILAWSQMHGNESNSTLAMLDFMETLSHNSLLREYVEKSITLDFIFMLNPDGAKDWTRRNALEIDINRDYLKESSTEIRLLKSIAFSKQYDYAFNLHEQKTVYSTDGNHPATLSFLAPPEDFEGTVTETRKKSMAVIASIYNALNKKIPNQIARYSDEFCPNASGDNFMKAGIPTILFEGGHFPNDYLRQNTRKYYTEALFHAIDAITQLKGNAEGFEDYFSIPENKESHFDIIYRNVKLNTNIESVLDIAVQYKEVIFAGDEEISFIPYVVEVGDLSNFKGWKDVDCTGRFVSENLVPKLDSIVDFKII